MKLIDFLIEQTTKYYYIGNCVSSFDDEGYCDLEHFYDVTDFAQQDENATTISKQQFDYMVDLSPELDTIRQQYDTTYLKYDNGLIVMYVEPVWHNNNKDEETDIHYFFAQ